jgi:uncharacterized OsmC-like protein
MADDPVQAGVSRVVGIYEEQPERAAVTFRADTELGAGLRCDTQTRKHALVVDEPPSIGGTGEGPNPIEVVLAGLAACQAITYQVWAVRLGLALDRVRVQAQGDVDLRGFFGVVAGVRAGFTAVRIEVALEGPEPDERYRELAEEVDRHCPVFDMLTVPAPLTRTLVEPSSVEA